ncbi:MAG: hypothetical protein KGL54_01230 [Sphingomonadales bacterium]|nr:hypothetical protein [Sphingomonadales bacterium]
MLLSIAGPAYGAPLSAQSHDNVEARIRPITARFVERMRQCARPPAYTPGIVIDSRPTLISFYYGDRSIHASRWSEMPPEVQGMLAEWAAKGTLGLTAEQQFAEVFNSLLVPHELGHFAASLNGRDKAQSFWDGEVYANRVAIAFWRGEPDGAAAFERRLENYNRFLDALPRPVPDGEQPRAWFESHYEQLGDNPAAYGWFQGLFMREARVRAARDEFCALIAPE